MASTAEYVPKGAFCSGDLLVLRGECSVLTGAEWIQSITGDCQEYWLLLIVYRKLEESAP